MSEPHNNQSAKRADKEHQVCRAETHGARGNIYRFRRIKWAYPTQPLRLLGDFGLVKPLLDRLSQKRFAIVVAICAFAGFFAPSIVAAAYQAITLPTALNPRCDIKGNISAQTGERIYHVRGQKYYKVTRISPRYGERWFCSEEDAIRHGWRKSRV